MESLPYRIVTGYAQLPQTTGAGVLHKHLTIIAKVSRENDEILDVATTLATRIANDFVREQLVGKVLGVGDDDFVTIVEQTYFGNGQKAITSAFKDLCRRYARLDGSVAGTGEDVGDPAP